MMEKQTFINSETFDFRAKTDYSPDGIVSKRVIQKDVGNITLFAFDKGQQLSEHTAPYDALVQVLDGSAEITIDGKAHRVDEGKSIIMPAGIPHAVYAVDRFKMLLTMIKE
jgi:quercetin dioxygenase-like cupin family protein